ncbi:MAG: helix-turn-helix transcriptional regulator [Alloprevotella sp.]|nr:helix-turn-helix transcriptional regulator [Alloprevotella sp.]
MSTLPQSPDSQGVSPVVVSPVPAAFPRALPRALAAAGSDAMAVVVCHEGRLTCHLDGSEVVVAAGQWLVSLPPSAIADVRADAGSRGVLVAIAATAWQTLVADEDRRPHFRHLATALRPPSPAPLGALPADRVQALLRLVEVCETSASAAPSPGASDPWRPLALSHLAAALVAQTLDLLAAAHPLAAAAAPSPLPSSSPSPSSSHYEAAYRRFVEAIRRQDGRLQPMAFYVEQTGMSVKQLNAATTRMVGLTAYSCVQQLTAQCAAAILAATDAPIADIVVRLGYSSPTFFTRFFRENMGCTPTAWRKQQALATPGAM